MVRKRKIIKVPAKNVVLLANRMNVGKVTVWNALAYRSDSENAQQIRKLAISEYGGVETTETVFTEN